MVNFQNYVRPGSLEEAYELNQNKKNKIVAGMLWLREGDSSYNTAIDLCELGLNSIEETAEEFSIGAMVTLRQLELHKGLNDYTNGAVKNAVKDIVGVQFRNMATIGGSLYGRFGFSDVLTVFLATDCYVELYKGGIVSLNEFSKMKYDNDILVKVIVKKTPGRFVYTSMRATRTDFPIIALCISNINGKIKASVGARPSKAILIEDSNCVLGTDITEEKADEFAKLLAENVPTGSNTRASSEYRTHLIRVLAKRSLLDMGGAY